MSDRIEPSAYGPEILEQLRALALPVGDYAVFGSGPMLVRGIIDTVSDLDVLCRGMAWSKAQELATSTAVEEGVAVVRAGPISFGTRWGLGGIDVNRLIDEVEIIDGLPFAPLEAVVAYKRAAGRPKDVAHLELIRAWIAGESPPGRRSDPL